MFYIQLEPSQNKDFIATEKDYIWLDYTCRNKDTSTERQFIVISKTKKPYYEFNKMLIQIAKQRYYNHFMIRRFDFPMIKLFMAAFFANQNLLPFKRYFKIETAVDLKKIELIRKYKNLHFIAKRKARKVYPARNDWMYEYNNQLIKITDDEIMNGKFTN